MLPLALLSLAMWVGGIVAIIAGIGWARTANDRSSDLKEPGSHS